MCPKISASLFVDCPVIDERRKHRPPYIPVIRNHVTFNPRNELLMSPKQRPNIESDTGERISLAISVTLEEEIQPYIACLGFFGPTRNTYLLMHEARVFAETA